MRRTKNNQPRFQLAHVWNADQLDQYPLAELGDFPADPGVETPALQLFAPAAPRKGIGGLHGEPPGLLQLPLKFMTDLCASFGILPIGQRGSPTLTNLLTTR